MLKMKSSLIKSSKQYDSIKHYFKNIIFQTIIFIIFRIFIYIPSLLTIEVLVSTSANAATDTVLVVEVSATWKTATKTIRIPGSTTTTPEGRTSGNDTRSVTTSRRTQGTGIGLRGANEDGSLSGPASPVGLATDHHIFRHRRTAIPTGASNNHISG